MQRTPNFQLFDIPYWNSLTAGQFDASTSFDANMPASHVTYSLQTLGLYLQPGQTKRPDVLEWPDVPEIGVSEFAQDEPLRPGYRRVEQCTDGDGNVVPKGTPGAECRAVQVRDAGIGAPFSLPGLPSLEAALTSPVVKDVSKRVGLALLAALIIAVAIFSMRP